MGVIREKPVLAFVLLFVALVALVLSFYFTTRPSQSPPPAPAVGSQAETPAAVSPADNTRSRTVPY